VATHLPFSFLTQAGKNCFIAYLLKIYKYYKDKLDRVHQKHFLFVILLQMLSQGNEISTYGLVLILTLYMNNKNPD
jgi:hypothetical protein